MKKFAVLMVFALLFVTLWGCQSVAAPQARTTEPTVTTEEPLEIVLPLNRQSAIEIALHHVGVINEQVLHLHARRDWDGGAYHYDVDFRYGDYHYAYEISEETGEILKLEVEHDRNEIPQTQISQEEAIEVALKNEELNREDVTSLTVEFDAEDHRYEIEFFYDGVEYTYEVCAEFAKILDIDKNK